ncbi:MAG: hypothetical protein QFB87_04765 [Patescibacteria group bacterium]|nr:hypothetical protein [Patescibacteria group bacterium]
MFKNKKTNKPTIGRQRVTRPATERPSAFSYYARRSDELLNTGRQIARSETAEQARATSRYWKQRFGLGILLICGIICLVYISTLSNQPRIVIAPSSTATAVLQDQSVYESAASQILASSIFNRNKITVSTSGLAAQLAKRFPELASVQVALPLLTHRLTVSIANAEPVLLLATGTGSYALDAGGTALLTGSQLSGIGSLHLPLVTDDSSVKVSLRQQALTTDNVSFILTVLAQLKAHNLTVASLTLPAGASELDVRLTDQPYFVKFNLASNSGRQQVGTLLAVYDRLKQQNVTPGEYIDVRVDGRAYYR